MTFVESEKYRKDIDGLRTIAVVSVILFHFGFLPNGYLGVDVFFVISGFLITGIIYRETSEGKFSLLNFYKRRTRRIIPLVSFVSLIALFVGFLVMLPDDLENLAQSVIATNFFANNILAAITTKNYWDVVNEFKPLMHTWSLAIEEQFYLIYPFVFIIFGKQKKNWILPILIILTGISMIVFFLNFKDFYKFYLLPFRFFELSIGGIASILLNNKLLKNCLSPILVLLLSVLLIVEIPFFSKEILLVLTVLTTCGILISANNISKISSYLLENKISNFIGKISFSLYMWHQIILAFNRYFVSQEFDLTNHILSFLLIFILSVLTYFLIEQPFRNKSFIKFKNVAIVLILFFIVSNSFSYIIYSKAGVFQDVPELNIKKGVIQKNMHRKYNEKNRLLDKNFNSNKTKVLVIGDSFGRDWVNVLLESKFNEFIEISYLDVFDEKHPDKKQRSKEANIIFYCTVLNDNYNIDSTYIDKSWCVGTKNFGVNNGYFYNKKTYEYCLQKTKIGDKYLKNNMQIKALWKDKFIDLIKYCSTNGTTSVFTSDCKFISQDCRHLTHDGAKHFAMFINTDKSFILNRIIYNDTTQ